MEAKFPSGTVSLLNDLVEKAVNLNASDIHIEPGAMNLRVRYRVDGLLQNGILISRSMQQQLLSRIKIMADLDISELKQATGSQKPFHAIFIRAPIIESVQADAKVLSILPDRRIVAAQQGHFLATSFHPELTNDARFHEYFLSLAD